jgi:hypothetical protein
MSGREHAGRFALESRVMYPILEVPMQACKAYLTQLGTPPAFICLHLEVLHLSAHTMRLRRSPFTVHVATQGSLNNSNSTI